MTNKVWVIYAPIALSISIIQLLIYQPNKILPFCLSVGLTVGFAFLLFYSGGFGGADSKALMCIAFALPFFPVVLVTPILANGLSPLSQIMFPITILSNSVLIAALSAFGLLIWNIGNKVKNKKPLFEGSLAQESIIKKIVVLVTGKRFSIETLKEKWHVYPMEDIISEDKNQDFSKRKLIIVPRDEGRDEVVARLSEAAEEGKIDSKVWATPGLPMLIFITVGLVISLSLGDMIWIVVSHLFG